MIKVGKHSLLVAVLLVFGSAKLVAQDLLISGGNTISSIICANGNVYAWGKNTQGTPSVTGTLGTGSAAAQLNSPQAVNFPTTDPYFNSISLGITVKAVDAGSGGHFIALDCYGGAWSWGNNGGGTGITGTGTAVQATTTPARVVKGLTPGGASIDPTLTNYLVNVKYISGGNNNSYAILNTGEAVAWGDNGNGQVGNGTTTSASVPQYILTGPGTRLTNVIQIEAGDVTGYALVDPDGDGLGTVYSWGAGANGRLGRNAAGTANSGSESSDDSYARPVLNLDGTPFTNIRIISAGDVMCFAVDANNFMWAWGNGGWGNCTGTGFSGLSNSNPLKVVAGEWGTTAGAGFGQQYLKVKSIAGGQGYGMAVTTDGLPMAWGNDDACSAGAGGGNLGNGAGGSSGTPVIIRRSSAAGDYSTDAVSISDGDTWGFYTTSTNQIYAWGSNDLGQLGVGNTTCGTYAVPFSLTCTPPAPKPSASISPRSMTVCSSSFAGTTLNSQFVIGAALAPNYTVTWFRNGSSVQTGPASVAGNLTYNVPAGAPGLGTYKVQVSYVGTDAPCAPYLPAEDQIVISAYTQNFTVPSPLTFCGTLTPYVTGLGRYNWFKDPTGGSSLATTLKNNPASITKASVNAPSGGVYTVYVQETGAYTGNVGPVTPTSCGSITSNDNNNWRNIIITVTDPQITIDTVTIWVKGETGAAKTWNWQINAYKTKVNGPGKTVADFGSAAVATGPVVPMLNPSNGGAWVQTKIPVNITLTGNGATYAIAVPKGLQTGGTNNPNLADFDCSLFPKRDDISTGGPYVSATGGSDPYTNDKTQWGTIGNIHFSTSQQYCDRVPVTLTEVCPCAPPTALSVSPSTTTTICQGANQTITGSYTLGSPTNGYNFVWYKGVAPGSPSYTPIASYANFTITGAVAGDAGTYTLRIEDGTAGNSACYREASVTIVVTAPITTPSVIANNQIICNGSTPATLTQTTAPVGGTGTILYQWYSSTDNFVSNSTKIVSAMSSSYSPGALASTTYYRRRDSSGVCPGVNSNIITITTTAPTVAGAIASDQSICSGTAPTALTNTTAPTGGTGTYFYKWQQATNSAGPWSYIAGQTTNGYTAPTLLATTYYRRIDSSGACAGVPTAYVTITVLGSLNPGTITADQNICFNTTPANLSSTLAASGGAGAPVYSWEQSTDNGTTWGAAPASSNSLTYTFPGALSSTIEYRRKVVAGAGACNTGYTTPVTVTVYANLTPGSISADQSICSGITATTLANATSPAGGSGTFGYSWNQSTDGGTTWNPIGGASSATYAPGALTTTTKYERIVTSATCPAVTSNVVTVTVTPNTTATISINGPGATCTGTPMNYTINTQTNQGGSPGYQWYVNGSPVGGQTGVSYSPTTLSNGDVVTLILSSSIACTAAATSNAMTASVVSNVTPTINIPTSNSICAGTSVTFTTTNLGSGTTPTYVWHLNGGVVGTNTDTYTNAALVNGDQVYVVMTSSLTCATVATATSNTITMNVKAIPTPQIVGGDKSICSGSSVSYTATVGSGNLQWNKDGVAISGSTASSIAINSSGTYTLTENNGACATTSAPVVVAILTTPVANAGADQYVKEGTAISLDGSGGVNYLWTPATGLSSATVANPTLTANNIITYTLTAYDATNACSSQDAVTIFVEKQIVIPNAITPNGDNNNDEWIIENLESFPNCTIEIYNRWGTLVWKTTGTSLHWKGTNYRNDEVLPDGTYFYIIDLKGKVYNDPYTGYIQVVK
jgi:gliding motility-associated-like protein